MEDLSCRSFSCPQDYPLLERVVKDEQPKELSCSDSSKNKTNVDSWEENILPKQGANVRITKVVERHETANDREPEVDERKAPDKDRQTTTQKFDRYGRRSSRACAQDILSLL